VPFLAFKGEWWHTRVGYGLGRALLGTDVLAGNDLKEFEDKAVDFSQGTGLMKLRIEIRPANWQQSSAQLRIIWAFSMGQGGLLHFKGS
jgi:hypothetical protein